MLSDTIDSEIKSAMLAKDQARLRGLRAIKAAFLLAKTEKGGTELDQAGELKILQKLVKQRKESAAIYEQQGRADLYEIEADEIRVIETYLPAQMSEGEIRSEIEGIIAALGGASMKDMGKVMGLANSKLGGKADGKLISGVVKAALSADAS